jgi:hypothetical protein
MICFVPDVLHDGILLRGGCEMRNNGQSRQQKHSESDDLGSRHVSDNLVL